MLASASPVLSVVLVTVRGVGRNGAAIPTPRQELFLLLSPIVVAVVVATVAAWLILPRLRPSSRGTRSICFLIRSIGFSSSTLLPVVLMLVFWLASVTIFKSELVALASPVIYALSLGLIWFFAWKYLKAFELEQ